MARATLLGGTTVNPRGGEDSASGCSYDGGGRHPGDVCAGSAGDLDDDDSDCGDKRRKLAHPSSPAASSGSKPSLRIQCSPRRRLRPSSAVVGAEKTPPGARRKFISLSSSLVESVARFLGDALGGARELIRASASSGSPAGADEGDRPEKEAGEAEGDADSTAAAAAAAVEVLSVAASGGGPSLQSLGHCGSS